MAGDLNIATALGLSLQTLKNIEISNEKSNAKIFFEQFRVIISSCQKLTTTPNALLPPCLTELAEILLETLAKKIPPPLETVTLCGVAFALVLTLVADASSIAMMYSKTFISCRDDNSSELSIKLSKASDNLYIKIEGSEDAFKLSLCHGLLQTPDSFWNSGQVNWTTLLQGKMFPILEKQCLSYTHLSLLSFKALVCWCRRMRNVISGRMCSNITIRIMNIVASNWESPMNGVREQNSLLLEQLLHFTDISEPIGASSNSSSSDADLEVSSPLQSQALLNLVITEMSWMTKSKYFFLAAILPKAGLMKSFLMHSEDIVSGLMISLCYTHLASAGTDLYRVCIDSISLDQWEQTFHKPIFKVLTSSKYTLQKRNVFNYWLAPTIKKYKITLQILLDSLLECRHNNVMLPIVCCLKAGRKEGYESMKWSAISTSPHLTKALRNFDEMTREQAFASVCNSSKTSVFPCDEEFQTVETFLTENINSDSSPMRQSLIKSFSTFICRTRDACLQVLRTKYNQRSEPSHFESRTLTRAMIFLEWLYNFLRSNLEIGSNYQRKTTSLELYKIVLSHLSNESNSKRNNSKSDGQRVMKYAIVVGKWGFTSEVSRESLLYTITDETEEVRESAASLLINHFKMSDSEGTRFKELFHSGISLCCDPMFYIADSGALLVYVVTCLVYKNPSGDCKCLEIKEDRIIAYLLNLAEKHLSELKSDLLRSATTGYPLYGILRVIDRLVNDKDSPEYRQFTYSETKRLLTVIETTVQHFLQVLASKSSHISVYAPSFLEMGEAIESAVEHSSVNIEASDQFQLSPAYQLVLNLIWLNLKACCMLVSRMHRLCGCDPSRCLSVITSVLRRTRHKGALEAAGLALAHLTRSLIDDGNVEHVEATLTKALDKLSFGRTQSTRGAGAIILIHKLVANDSRPDKPMLEKCLNHVLSLVERREGDTAQALHLLGVLLKDSSLSQETARITHKLAAACFNSLAHTSWAIRNTALQLFGAIVPKLIGQRKQNDDDTSCSCYHLSYEELYYHTPQLVEILLTELEVGVSCSTENELAVHSKLVPLLTLLSNLSVGILTIIDRSIEGVFNKLVGCFQTLMSSGVFKVRQLSARSNAWFCSLSQLPSLVRTRVWKIVAYVNDRTIQNEIKTENGLHGFLLNTLYLYRRFQEERDGITSLREQDSTVEESLEELRSIRHSLNMSFVCKSVLEQLVGFDRTVSGRDQMANLCAVPTTPHTALGHPLWVSTVAKQIIESCPLSELLPSLSFALDSDVPELHRSVLDAIHFRINQNDFEAVSNGALNIILKFIKKKANEESLNVLLEILLKYRNLSTNVDLDPLIESLCNDDRDVSTCVCCGLVMLASEPSNKLMNLIVKKLSDMCQPNKSEDSRLLGSRGICLLSPVMLHSATEDCFKARSEIWSTAVNLLQDESRQVRIEASKFTNSLVEAPPPEEPLNPFVSLNFLFNEKTLSGIFPPKYSASCLWSRLKCSQDEFNTLNKVERLNPFDSRDNRYQEDVKTAELTYEVLHSLLKKDEEAKAQFLQEEIIPYLKIMRSQAIMFLEFAEEQTCNRKILLNSSWYVIAKKLAFQFCLVESLNNNSEPNKELNMFQFRFQSFVEQMLNLLAPVRI